MSEKQKYCTNPFRKYLMMRLWGKYPRLHMLLTIIAIQVLYHYIHNLLFVHSIWLDIINWYEKAYNVPQYNLAFGFEDVLRGFFMSIFECLNFDYIVFVLLGYKFNKLFHSQDYNENIRVIPGVRQRIFVQIGLHFQWAFCLCAVLLAFDIVLANRAGEDIDGVSVFYIILSAFHSYYYKFPIFILLTLIGGRLKNFWHILWVLWAISILNQALFMLMRHTEILGLYTEYEIYDIGYNIELTCFITGIVNWFFVLLFMLYYFRKFVKQSQN